jgi:hypothetical protein
MKVQLLVLITSLFGLSVLTATQISKNTSEETSISKEYRKCLRAHSKGKLNTSDVRYGDELFASSFKKCSTQLPKAQPDAAPVDQAYRLTQIYIATLNALNSFPRPKEEYYDTVSSINAPQSPPQDTQQFQKELDSFMQRDFITLYNPWLYCLTSEMKNRGEVKPEEFIKQATIRCKKVSNLSDNEFLLLLNKYGNYGDAENKNSVLFNSKKIFYQMAMIGALREDGEKLGTAIKRSEEATQ